MLLRARQFEFRFPRPALIMGVLNVTPDSFSDGGRHFAPEAAVEQGLRLVAEGADVLDIGGESTRPGAAPVSEEEEVRRVVPVIRTLAARLKIPISVDTMKPAVALAALEAGASLVNDVAAHRQDESLWRSVARHQAGYVAMHMQGEPATMQAAPSYDDVVSEIDAFFGDRLQRMAACGLRAEAVILDPGLGFGKTLDHNLKLLANLKRFGHWERPVLVGISRKSFIGSVSGATVPSERLPGSLAGAVWSCLNGAHIVRTHDVAWTRQALRTVEAIQERQTTDPE